MTTSGPDDHGPSAAVPSPASSATPPHAPGHDGDAIPREAPALDGEVLALEPEDLDGHAIDELADYLDAGMVPPDPSIDESPACQSALAALVRLRAASTAALEAAALEEPPLQDSWVNQILSNISLEVRAGRSIPLTSTSPTEHAVLTEGAVRSLVRHAGDAVDGILVGRCTLDGDVTAPGAPVAVRVDASIVYGNAVAESAQRLRAAVSHELLTHTELNVTDIDVVIRDVHLGVATLPEVER